MNRNKCFGRALLCCILLCTCLLACPQALAAEDGEEAPELTVEWLRAQYAPADVVSGPLQDLICYMGHHGILTCDRQLFNPDQPVSRAMVAVTLYRMSGSDGDTSLKNAFSDVPADTWYTDGVNWCAANGLMNGVGNGLFAPEQPLSRMQLATLLYRYAAWQGRSTAASFDLSAYPDGFKVSDYALDGMRWAMAHQFFRGVVGDQLCPGMTVLRRQLAVALTGLLSYDGSDPMAAELLQALPERVTKSDALVHHAEIQAAVDAAAEKYHSVGIQVAVIENGALTEAFHYGWATKDTDPMTDRHKIRAASISKVVLGMTAMLLREQGTVSLDESIGTYWGFPVKNPAYPDTPVTIRSILTHTSSIFNAGDNEPRLRDSVAERLKGTGFSKSIPGDMGYWSYNNYAFGVLGMTLELAANRRVDEILQEKLFAALDIDASYAAGDIADIDRLATIYQSNGAVGRSAEKAGSIHFAKYEPGADGTYFAGGLTISASELARLVALLANDGLYEGVRLMSEESVALMEQCASRTAPEGFRQAMPLRCQDDLFGRGSIYYHTGSAYGEYNCISYDPATGDGVVVLTTGSSGSKTERGIYSVCSEISEAVYEAIK